MTIWGAIRRFRESLRMSQRELAELSGRDQAYISRLEQGKVNAETVTLSAVAAAVDADVMLVPRNLVPQVNALIDREMAPAPSAAPAARTTASVFDDVFIPDPEGEDDEDGLDGGPRP